MKQLLIIGAGGLGREVYCWAKQSKDYQTKYEIKGFLDKSNTPLDKFDYPVSILGDEDEYKIQKEDVFVCAIGNLSIRKNVVEKMENRGAVFINIIHSSCVFGESVELGVGNIFAPFCLISCDTKIQNHNIFNGYVFLGHDVSVGSYNQIDAYSFCGGNAQIKDGCNLFPHSIVTPSVKIMEQSKIGAGSLMLRNARPNTTYFGLPAKKTFL